MADEKVTSLEVAALAGVSQSAVSRVFTPGSSVSKKTAEKVLAAAAQLGYRPNVLARAMKSGKSRIIGLVVAYLENYFYPEMVERLSVELQKVGYHVLIFLAPVSVDNVDKVVREIMDYQVDGIVLASVSVSSDLAARCQSTGIPVVLFNRGHADKNLCSVTSDNFAGGKALADYLCSLGHQRIAYIAGFSGATTQIDREAGLSRRVWPRRGKIFSPAPRATSTTAPPSPHARELFATSRRPDAVFVANDHMAFAVMDVLRFELGLRVPRGCLGRRL